MDKKIEELIPVWRYPLKEEELYKFELEPLSEWYVYTKNGSMREEHEIVILENYDKHILVDTGYYKTSLFKKDLFTRDVILSKKRIPYLVMGLDGRKKLSKKEIKKQKELFYRAILDVKERFSKITKGGFLVYDKTNSI